METKQGKHKRWEVFRFQKNCEGGEELGGFGVRDAETKETICDNEQYYPHAVDEKHIALIASAPMMYEALKDVQKAYQDMFDVMPVAWQTYAHIVDEAIKQAEGRA